jgi:hypothetical protein
LFLKDTEKVPHLEATMNNEQFLDAISAPKVELGMRGKKRAAPLGRKERGELGDG